MILGAFYSRDENARYFGFKIRIIFAMFFYSLVLLSMTPNGSRFDTFATTFFAVSIDIVSAPL